MSERRKDSTSTRVRAAVLGMMLAATTTAGADDPGEVGERWVQFALSFPEDQNPLNDDNGALCTVGQRGSSWYLAITTGNPIGQPVDRECTIPIGKTLIVPIVSWVCIPQGTETGPDARRGCRDANDQTDILRLRIDNARREDLIVRRNATSLFPLPLPEGNLLGLDPMVALAVHDSYFAIVPALPVGEHVIRIQGATTALGFTTDVRYTINVVRAAKLP